MFGHLPVVKQLVAAGTDISWKNRDGLTAVQVAKQQKFTSVVDYLEERRATNNAKVSKGKANGFSVQMNGRIKS